MPPSPKPAALCRSGTWDGPNRLIQRWRASGSSHVHVRRANRQRTPPGPSSGARRSLSRRGLRPAERAHAGLDRTLILGTVAAADADRSDEHAVALEWEATREDNRPAAGHGVVAEEFRA